MTNDEGWDRIHGASTPAPHVGQPCGKAPEASAVHLFCYSGYLTEGPWESVAACKWCGITPNGELTRPRPAA